jgi:UDP-glucuronate 4-epimerase
MDSKTIVITGAAGFIGSQLSLKLQGLGHKVFGIDNLNDHLYNPILKMKRHNHFGVPLAEADIRDPVHMRQIFKHIKDHGNKIDYLIHLAAHAGVRDSFGKEGDYHSNNIDGTQTLINHLKTHSPETKVIYASTSSVYGGTPIGENGWTEEFVQAHQLNAYAYTKYVNECQFKIADCFAVGLRFFTVYGPWGRPDMALFQFTKKILDGEPIDVYNYGDMKRDFTYIEDILNGIVIVLENIENGKIDDGEIFNIGRGQQVQLMDFVKAIETNVGKDAIINLAPKHPADTKETWSNTEKLQAFGYRPETSINEGVAKFYEWYKKFYNVENV